MDKIFLLTFVLLSFLLIFSKVSVSEYVMNVTVTWAPNIKISIYTDEDFYCQPALVNITNSLENVGNLLTTGNLSSQIFGPNGILYNSTKWDDIILDVLDQKNYTFSLNFTDNPIGVYTINSQFTYNSKVSSSSKTITIGKDYGKLQSYPTGIDVTLFPGESIPVDVYFWMLYACNSSELRIVKGGEIYDWVFVENTTLFLQPDYTNKTKVTIFVPYDTPEGDYYGYLNAYLPDQYIQIPIHIRVQKSAIFDVVVNVLQDEVCLGDYVTANVTIVKVYPPTTIDINITYRIISPNNTIVSEKREFVAIENEIRKQESLIVNSNLEGTYYFSVIVSYGNSVFEAYDFVLAKECKPPVSIPSYIPPTPPKIYEKKITLLLSRHRLFLMPGNSTNIIAYVKNEWNGTMEDVKVKIRALPRGWIFVSPSSVDIQGFQTFEFNLLVSIPETAKEGTYYGTVIASDDVESNEEVLIISVYKDYERLAKAALRELENLRKEIDDILKLLPCIRLEEIYGMIEEADIGRNHGLKEFERGNYKEALKWFEIVISKYERILGEIKVEVIAYVDSYKPFSLPPFSSKIEELKGEIKDDVRKNKFEKVCDKLGGINKLSSYSLLLLVGIFVGIVPLAYLLYLVYKRRKIRYAIKKLEEIRERLKEV